MVYVFHHGRHPPAHVVRWGIVFGAAYGHAPPQDPDTTSPTVCVATILLELGSTGIMVRSSPVVSVTAPSALLSPSIGEKQVPARSTLHALGLAPTITALAATGGVAVGFANQTVRFPRFPRAAVQPVIFR